VAAVGSVVASSPASASSGMSSGTAVFLKFVAREQLSKTCALTDLTTKALDDPKNQMNRPN